ncbi:TrkH family potassium uptake protein [Acetohalobium arabaticum]|uniref:Potassium uptake protein, TrkH family n=1 Tax=Acetohalobium arabaticum (strain ATCC 49924 / DSM 5501 / Z-7288) TaxID=574087 RepID=D9QUE7_ACEAZ|nr:TrkH family potassium uptake protein [Acetohalobium arabaticum]ADL11940.1 potassium uptake protein, TrkH family [Acetohalobium arabaticum DSM 5501]
MRIISFKLDSLSPAQFLALGYIIVITVGALLLMLPAATVDGQGLGLINSLFTATSATAVTGLIVVNTGAYFTLFGQAVILLLIQIGGLGFMTTSTLLALILGKRINLKKRIIIQEDLNYFNLSGLIRLVQYVTLLTLGVELIGAILLFAPLSVEYSAGKAAFFSIFHAVSAFCNAGFDLFGNSLANFTNDVYINLVITALFIIGGIGFAVIADVYRKQRFIDYSLNTKLVLVITLILIILGTCFVFLLEFSNPATLQGLSFKGKLLAAYFQGVTPRTAGFNTIPTGQMRNATLFFIIILMFIGASPGSTGGGLKTTTIGALLAVVYNLVKGNEDIELFERRLSQSIIYKALAVTIISLIWIGLVVTVLTITEEANFLSILFETVSAYGTVGLSTGITGGLSEAGRIIIILTMFLGRVGPLTLAVAIGERDKEGQMRYPEEKILIG